MSNLIIILLAAIATFTLGVVQFFRLYSGVRPIPGEIIQFALLNHLLNAALMGTAIAVYLFAGSDQMWPLIILLAIVYGCRVLVTKHLQKIMG